MSSEGLQRGNASILLPNDQDADGTTYTCFVIYSPDSEKELIELRVEAVCNLSKFNPSQINVQWLQNGVPQEQVKSEVHRMHNGMFSINSVFLPQKNNVKVTYICRVEHEGFETPLEQSVRWRPGPSVVVPWLLGFIIGFGFGLALAASIAYYKAKPGSDVLLPCYFEKSSGHIDLKSLAVIWSVGTRDIAKYEDKLEVFHPGAKMSSEGLQQGNASILLPNVQDADGAIYTCFVIHSPDSEKESILLRVEAAPLVKLGSTKVQLTKPSTVACTATDFYPGNISMTWFRNDRIVQGPEWPPAQPSTGQLFRAESLLKLIPEFSDANANYSCHIHHQAREGPEVLKFQLHLQGEYNLLLSKQGTQVVVDPYLTNLMWLGYRDI
ncbi:hypothetical protein E2320_003131 [Naja naja]|nr:hypothetical protein E2320_003131 [Naja naja]